MFVVAPAGATLITANNAGPLPATAEDLTGTYPTEIMGTIPDDSTSVSVFKIDILMPVDFSAFTIQLPFGIPDPELFLFDSSGIGVYMNDDISGSNTQSCLPSDDASNPCPSSRNGTGPVSAGIYYLAITRSSNMPVDASNNELFAPLASTDVVGPVVMNPVAGWDGNAFTTPDTDLVNYDITLTGTVPEPATWLLTAGAALILMALRRKRTTR